MRTPITVSTIGAIIGAMILAAGTSLAAIAPQQNYTSDVSVPTTRRDLTFRQGTSQKLGWTYKQGSTALDVSGATVVFTYVPTSRAWSQAVTGAVDVATNGSVLVTFTPAQLNTNSGAVPFDWILEVSAGSEVLGYSYGKLNLLADPTSSVTNTFPTTTTAVDWSTVAAYTHTADAGPVRPGTGITATTNADGSITFAASGSGTDSTFTNYLAGDTEIVVTGDPRSGRNVLSIASGITRDTELTAVQDTINAVKANNDSVGYNADSIQILPNAATAVATQGGGSVSPYAGSYLLNYSTGWLPYYRNSDDAYIVYTSGVWSVCYPAITTIVGTNTAGHRGMEGDYVALAGQWDAFTITRKANTDVYLESKTKTGTSFPDHAPGRMYYHSTSNKLFCSDGTAWNALW